jgi:hypothetical protein
MSPLTALKFIENFAIEYCKGSVEQAVCHLNAAEDCLREDEKEALYIYKEWKHRMDNWLEYIK